jgi:hypothetical protein
MSLEILLQRETPVDERESRQARTKTANGALLRRETLWVWVSNS